MNPEPQLAFVYVLCSLAPGKPRSYVGWTFDLERRLAEHNGLGKRGAKFTRGGCWQLVYAEKHPSKIAAMQREYHLKRDRRLRSALRDANAAA